jgi:hypothetical protein
MLKNFLKSRVTLVLIGAGSLFLLGGIVLGLYLKNVDESIVSSTTPVVVVNTEQLDQFADSSTTPEGTSVVDPTLVIVPVVSPTVSTTPSATIVTTDPSVTPVVPYADCGRNVQNDEITTLACNMYHEARGETSLGQLLVGLVTIARAKSDKFPDSIHDVVYQSKMSGGREVPQFNWTLDNLPDVVTNYVSWQRAMTIARLVYEVYQENVKMSINFGTEAAPNYVDWNKILFYHSVRPERPSWTTGLTVLGNIGNHTFYSY